MKMLSVNKYQNNYFIFRAAIKRKATRRLIVNTKHKGRKVLYQLRFIYIAALYYSHQIAIDYIYIYTIKAQVF